MRRVLSSKALWIAVGALLVWGAVKYLVTLYSSGPRCSTKACTYFSKGIGVPGTCGAKEGDDHQCYCIASNGVGSQPQSGCSIPGS